MPPTIRERRIERRLINLVAECGFPGADVIRRCSVGKGFGIIDLVLLPKKGRYKLVLIEAKRSIAPDAAGKVVGQLLLYHAKLSQLGSEGIKLMRAYCASHGSHARGVSRKSLQALAGISPSEAAWKRMAKGRRLTAREVALFIALEAEPSKGLRLLLRSLAGGYGLKVGVITASGGRELNVWQPKPTRARPLK